MSGNDIDIRQNPQAELHLPGLLGSVLSTIKYKEIKLPNDVNVWLILNEDRDGNLDSLIHSAGYKVRKVNEKQSLIFRNEKNLPIALNTIKKDNYITLYAGNKEIIMPSNPDDITKSDYDEEQSINLKSKAKLQVGRKFKIGDVLLLKGGIKDGSEQVIKEFVVKKVIWTVKNHISNTLILKQTNGTKPHKLWALNKNDCKRYHIKYEEGLQVYPMEMNFIKKK